MAKRMEKWASGTFFFLLMQTLDFFFLHWITSPFLEHTKVSFLCGIQFVLLLGLRMLCWAANWAKSSTGHIRLGICGGDGCRCDMTPRVRYGRLNSAAIRSRSPAPERGRKKKKSRKKLCSRCQGVVCRGRRWTAVVAAPHTQNAFERGRAMAHTLDILEFNANFRRNFVGWSVRRRCI